MGLLDLACVGDGNEFIKNQEKSRNFGPPDPFLDAIASIDLGNESECVC